MLDPKCTVLVKGGNSLFLWHETAARLVSGCLDELGYCLVGGPSFQEGSGSLWAPCALAAVVKTRYVAAQASTRLRNVRREDSMAFSNFIYFLAKR
jgi:hypothetical protein